jgi:hypothetical protein
MTLNLQAIKQRINEIHVIARLAKRRAWRTQAPIEVDQWIDGRYPSLQYLVRYESINWTRVRDLAAEMTALCMVRNSKHAPNLTRAQLVRIVTRVLLVDDFETSLTVEGGSSEDLRELIIERMSERYESESKAA